MGAAGTAKRQCIWCDAMQEKVLPEVGPTHDLGIVVAKEASCTEEGNIEFWSCADCGWVFIDAAGLQEVEDISSVITPKTPHIRGASVHENVKEATCTEDGSHDEVVHCRNCNATLSEGEHALTALFDDGPGVEVSFAEKKSAKEPSKISTDEKASTKGAKSPSTGDSLLVVAISVAAIVAAALALVARKKWRKQR